MKNIKKLYIYSLIAILAAVVTLSCVSNDDYSVPPVPAAGFFKETFNQVTKSNGDPISASPWPKVAAVINFDNEKEGVAYSDAYGTADIRKINGTNDLAKKGFFLWMPAAKNSSLTLDHLMIGNRKNITLRYRFNANVYNAGDIGNTNLLTVTLNDQKLSIPDTELNVSNNKNKYIGVMVRIPDNLIMDNSKLEFSVLSTDNTRGFRIKDIEFIENYEW
ncbi:hypothetical protein O2K51_05040 [Apibacter raozihei]|uniref:hypothetical protein n=1 Tax=Apibacter raozihei TaxID=2500547 RepID=UPI000FE2F4BF|nr:hypothetical protein [Apibacter raozihei]